MSNFGFEADVNNMLRHDSPLTQGPQMRWQRKLHDNSNISRNESFFNSSVNASMNASTNTSKTPSKKLVLPTALCGRKTPTAKTPKLNKTPGKGKTTPSRYGDRFIPSRSGTHFELGQHLLSRAGQMAQQNDDALSPSKRNFQQAMRQNLQGDYIRNRIMSYKNKPDQAPQGSQNGLNVLYGSTRTPCTAKKASRHIPQVSERILDAPEILDDYYLNLVDWSATNTLAVCLSGHVYLWNASTGDIEQLLEMEGQEDYVSSVSWSKDGNYLSVGTSTSEVQLWDIGAMKRLRVMSSHSARVGAMSWKDHVLSSGSRSGLIHHHDVRVAQHHIGTLAGHAQEVCGLRWSPDNRYLASGGNDNLLHVWPSETARSLTDSDALHTFNHHTAAVKALSWCPWQSSVLASGGGANDRHIRFWNCNNGSLLNSIDTKSQVCSILWSPEHKELISGHGYAQNQLIIWKYPTMTKVAELMGHTQRVLHMALSPDRTTVVSAAADETLRLWKCFDQDADKKKAAAKSAVASGMMRASIR